MYAQYIRFTLEEKFNHTLRWIPTHSETRHSLIILDFYGVVNIDTDYLISLIFN